MEALEEAIRTAAETVLNGTGSYIYRRPADASRQHDLPSPHFIFFDPNGREGNVVGSYSCLFLLAEPDPDTNTIDQRHDTYLRMSDLWNKFLAELDKHPLLQLGEVVTEKVVKVMDARLSGVARSVTISTPLPVNCEPVNEPF